MTGKEEKAREREMEREWRGREGEIKKIFFN